MFISEKSFQYGKGKKYTGSEIRTLKTTDTHQREYCYVWMLLELANEIGYKLGNIQKYIVAYKVCSGMPITKKLPVRVTPEFTSILAHFMGDGTDKKTRDGTTSYTQYNDFGLENFQKKIINVFGKPERCIISKKYHTVFVPKSITSILKKCFSVKSFGTYESSVPEILYSMPDEHKLAFLVAFLVDEGTIYDTVSFRLANRKLVEQVRKIAISLGYICSGLLTSRNKNGNVYGFSISNYSLRKLSNDIKRLSKKYPTCNLTQKQEHFDYLTSLGRSSIPKREVNKTKELLLVLLKDEPKTVLELAKLAGVCRRTTRGHLDDMERLKKVRVIGKKSMGAKLWLAI